MSKKTKKPNRPISHQRNFHACHPILRKGGVHEKTNKAKRQAAKQSLRNKISKELGRSFLSNQYYFITRLI